MVTAFRFPRQYLFFFFYEVLGKKGVDVTLMTLQLFIQQRFSDISRLRIRVQIEGTPSSQMAAYLSQGCQVPGFFPLLTDAGRPEHHWTGAGAGYLGHPAK